MLHGRSGGVADFLRRKEQILASLDKSPKGSLDAPILSFLAWLNAQPSIVTTSSCSGRIAVFLGSSDPASSKGGEWLVASHEVIDDVDAAWSAVKAGVEKAKSKDSGADGAGAGSLATFLMEPFLMHAECAEPATAQRVLEAAREAGMRESGLSLGKRRVMVQLRSLALRLEVPLAADGELLVDEKYFKLLIRLANERLIENFTRTERLWNRLKEALSSTHSVANDDDSEDEAGAQQPWVLVCGRDAARGAKLALEERQWLDESRKMGNVSGAWGEAIGLPITGEAARFFEALPAVAPLVTAEAEPAPGAAEAEQKLDAKAKKAARAAAALKPVDLEALWCQRFGPGGGSSSSTALPQVVNSDALPRKTKPAQNSTPGCQAAEQELREREAIGQLVAALYEKCYAARVGSDNADLAELLADVRALPPLQWRGDVALLPRGSLTGPLWEAFVQTVSEKTGGYNNGKAAPSQGLLWEALRKAVGARLLARQQEISVADGKRSGAIEVLAGDGNGWVVIPGPGSVRYTLDITKCMFSDGNAAEKARVAEWNVTGETILDLYTGIGFWTLPMLAAGAAKVTSCEWNPDAVEALRRGLSLLDEVKPGVAERCTILAGDNRREEVRAAVALTCHRVMLGLIPTSRDGFPNAVAALREEGGFLHVHWNVHQEEEKKTAAAIAEELQEMFRSSRGQAWTCTVVEVQRIKWFAPRIRHVRIDVECRQAAAAAS
eukprot:TRINITY_DN65628_c0_g1_i1.p1 TRINITY_DN65628_c0_g1~~TRINITY_DN65628_c0_g1_i1.p1  ORF type:complete len:724 (+),score=161.30 TRINITY_DN65628_c0_g1_i1:88-2259(+)